MDTKLHVLKLLLRRNVCTRRHTGQTQSLTSALEEGEWPTSRSSRFVPGIEHRYQRNRRLREGGGGRASLNVLKRIFCPYREPNPVPPNL